VGADREPFDPTNTPPPPREKDARPQTEKGKSMTNQTACLSCGRAFLPRRAGHVFCSSACRYSGERGPEERERADPELVARLFDDGRDPDDRVRPDDWHPSPDSEFVELDAGDTLAERRKWYRRLRREGLA
jgi:hypothetical protein